MFLILVDKMNHFVEDEVVGIFILGKFPVTGFIVRIRSFIQFGQMGVPYFVIEIYALIVFP